MKMIRSFFQKGGKEKMFKFFHIYVISMLVINMSLVGVLFAGSSTYSITGNTPAVSGTVVSLSGTASADPQTGDDSTQHMAVDWGTGDGWQVAPNGNLNFNPTFYDCGNKDKDNKRCFLDNNWTASKDYSSIGGGTFTIKVMVYHGNTPGEDGGATAIKTFSVEIITYSWYASSTWSVCSADCGGGTQTQNVECRDNNGVLVSDSYCDVNTKPNNTQACNTQACVTYSWYVTDDWDKCSAECGGGTQSKIVICQDNEGTTVDDSNCTESKPVELQSCNTQVCVTYDWYVTEWSTCSKDCGTGTQTRIVVCRDNSGNEVADSYCDADTKPVDTQDCNTQVCATYNWHAEAWGTCSKDCGTGTQTRTVVCYDGDGNEVADSYCDTDTKPADTQECNTQVCVTYDWYTTDWGTCSKDCGTGTQTRTVVCRDNSENEVSDSYCTTDKPSGEQSCNTDACSEPTGTIHVCKYEDTDGDGEADYAKELTSAGGFFDDLWNMVKVKAAQATYSLPSYPLGGWVINILGDNEYSDTKTTDSEDGCVDFTVPYGTYTITEEMQDNWTQTYPGAESEYSFEVTINSDFSYQDVYFLNHYEEPVTPELYCGDGECNNDETCSSCSQDCNSCSEDSGDNDSGSGGGGGSGYLPSELIISQERTSEVSGDYIVITWLTNKFATSRVLYDTVSHEDISGESAPNYGYAFSTEIDTEKVTGHSVTVSGLTPNTVYYFRPMSSASPEIYGKEVSFTTGDAGSAAIKVLGAEGIPNVNIVKLANKKYAKPGDEIEYGIIITNNGNMTVYEAKLKDVLPEGLLFAENNSNIKEWNIGNIDPGKFININYVVKVTNSANGAMKNIVTLSSDNYDDVSVNYTVNVDGIDTDGIKVLGIEYDASLPESGFSYYELLALLFTTAILFASSRKMRSVIGYRL